MSWLQQMESERRQWHEEMERRIQKMETDVIRGSALQRILEAERQAACLDAQHINTTEPKGNL